MDLSHIAQVFILNGHDDTWFNLIVFQERQATIGTAYIRFHDDIQIEALGPAQDGAPWLSKLLFCWVNPLVNKGLSCNLKRIDDLFELPESLSLNKTVEPLQNAITQTFSLFRALHRVFGVEFYLIGLLRFIGDSLFFAGPLLLGALLQKANPDADETTTNYESYLFAFGLFATALFGMTYFVLSVDSFDLMRIYQIFMIYWIF